MTRRPFDPALYLVTDRELAAGRTLDQIVGQALAGGVTMVQLREKQISTRDRVELAVRVGKLTRPSGAALIINDRVDVALAAEADGVHLGQEDMPAEVARRLIGPQRILGVTVADTDQARQAQRDGADYLGCNAVFDTPTKENTGSAMGLEGLQRLVTVMEYPTTLTYDELKKARFAKGPLSPNGKMYYPIEIPEEIDLKSAIRKGIKQTADWMLTIPVPLFGVKGIRYLSKRIRNWPNKLGPKRAAAYLAQLVRMLEEIGTGGAGFRFIYAAFLQEVSEVMKDDRYNELSKEMTNIGDKWRIVSSKAAQTCKGRSSDPDGYNTVANLMLEIADDEEKFFTDLKKLIK